MNFLKKLPKIILLLGFTLSFTSCEGTLDDIFGEWDRPTPADTSQKFDPLVTPLTFEAVSGEITLTVQTPLVEGKTIEYSVDNGATWTSATAKGDGNAGGYIEVISIKANKILLRGKNDNYYDVYIKVNEDSYVYGNIMSLIFGADYIGKYTLDKEKNKSAFSHLFSYNPHILSHESKELVLPATSLAPKCYYGLFMECTNLKRAPALPATDLTGCDQCYMDMFEACRSLIATPALPATKLSKKCYTGIFHYCDKLKEGSVLPATDLTGCDDCYANMFFHCKGIIKAPDLPATKLAKECYYAMFCGCPELEIAPDLPATQLEEGCYDTMFASCSKLTKAPTLPAETLVSDCYYYMFKNCAKLGSVTCLATSGFELTRVLSEWITNAGTDESVTTRTLYVKSGHSGENWKAPTGTYAWNIVDNQ